MSTTQTNTDNAKLSDIYFPTNQNEGIRMKNSQFDGGSYKVGLAVQSYDF